MGTATGTRANKGRRAPRMQSPNTGKRAKGKKKAEVVEVE
jgi:hypothetical protein